MFSPWITVTHSKASSTVKEYQGAWKALNLNLSSKPLLTLMIGKKVKSEVLSQFVRKSDNGFLANGHGQVYLWPDPATVGTPTPRVYVDFELQAYVPPHCDATPGIGPEVSRLINWLEQKPAPLNRMKINNLLSSRVLGSVSDVVCYFASDFGGMRAVAALLAEQIQQESASNLPADCLPSVLVVADTTSPSYDSQIEENKLMESIAQILRKSNKPDPIEDVQAMIRGHFHQVRIVGIRKGDDSQSRARVVRRRLTAMCKRSLAFRAKAALLFSFPHIIAIFSNLLDHFCSNNTRPFCFIKASRASGMCLNEFSDHLRELWNLTPSEAWFWHLVCPLLSSCIVLAGYPPHSHSL